MKLWSNIIGKITLTQEKTELLPNKCQKNFLIHEEINSGFSSWYSKTQMLYIFSLLM